MKKIQVLIYALSIICIICSLFLIKQKRDYDLLKKDVDAYINEINSLENEISNYESKKEQVKEELVSNLDENNGTSKAYISNTLINRICIYIKDYLGKDK